MSKPSIPAKGGALRAQGHNNPPEPDPVAEIGWRLAAVTAARDKFEEAIIHQAKSAALEHELENFDLHRDSLKHAILTQPATTLAGAMVQVACIYWETEGNMSGDESRENRVQFALFSVLDVLERESGVNRETFLLNSLTGTRSDMVRHFAEAMQKGAR
jgi:hypothetical protein